MTVPAATYRLQFRNGMDFALAAALAPYFKALGVSHIYASPVFKAAPGSTHGYDIVDFNEVEPELGGRQGFDNFVAALHAHGLGLILDFVPNHMAASPHNPWWRDVLRFGAESTYARHFDIDWSAPKLLLPILGKPYEAALNDGELGLRRNAVTGEPCLTYYETELPLHPASHPEIGEGFDYGSGPDRRFIHAIHERQIWRLADWRLARNGLTYRRFFEISGLAGVRIEDPEVFADAHRLLLDMAQKGQLAGVRLDHIDGLALPKTYLETLRDALRGTPCGLVWAEKILEPGEALPEAWPVDGTTGYEFIAAAQNLFVDQERAQALTDAYTAFTGQNGSYDEIAGAAKRQILTYNLEGELNGVTRLAGCLAKANAGAGLINAQDLRRAVIEIAAAFPLYRTYIDATGASAADRATISEAAQAALKADNENDEALHFIRDALLLDVEPHLREQALAFALRFQQMTGPLMAKAIEDTAYYRYNRLIALNEVGASPAQAHAPHHFHAAMQERLERQPLALNATATHDTKRGVEARARLYAVSEMPEAWAQAVSRWADMLQPQPQVNKEVQWLFFQGLLGAWPANLTLDDVPGLETLTHRMTAYMIKALREAKTQTSWTAPDAAFEDAVKAFAARALDPKSASQFLSDFAQFAAPVIAAGALTGLSQLACKLTAPGIPDIYQGTELWDLSLVDPDNRRLVDFDARAAMLDHDGLAAALADWRSGALKLALMRTGLQLRRELPALFAEGGYLPLDVEGQGARFLAAFARSRDGKVVVTLAPRLTLQLLQGANDIAPSAAAWNDTYVALPQAFEGRAWHERITGRSLDAADRLSVSGCLHDFPIAFLVSKT